MRIVMLGMDPGVNLAEMCRREGISPTQFYGWKKKLLSSAKSLFEDKKKSAAEERLAAENRRLKEVIAEITSENLELKKGLSS
jgi:transposase-like protein